MHAGPELVGEPFGGETNLRGGSSTWQSLARGTGDIECDFLNGEISLMGAAGHNKNNNHLLTLLCLGAVSLLVGSR